MEFWGKESVGVYMVAIDLEFGCVPARAVPFLLLYLVQVQVQTPPLSLSYQLSIFSQKFFGFDNDGFRKREIRFLDQSIPSTLP